MSLKPKRVMSALYFSFGCKVNQVELQSLREELARNGVAECGPGDVPDIAIINTCSVTATAEAKLRQKVRALHRISPHLRVFLIGCTVEHLGDSLRELPGVEAVFGNSDKGRVVEHLLRYDARVGSGWFPVTTQGHHARAFIKVQDGCPEDCSYCIVGKLRGRPMSRPIPEVVEEVARLADAGVPEIVLVGVNLGAWGRESGSKLASLIRPVAGAAGDTRIRLSSLEPQCFDEELLDALADAGPALCRHFHMPVQSGSNKVLADMGRRCDARYMLDMVERITDRLPGTGFTADIIVGYPTEGETEFADTMALAIAAGFHRIHAFSYSPRPGTRAWVLGDPVDGNEKRRRMGMLKEIAEGNLDEFVRSLDGQPLEVVFDGQREPDKGREGYSAEYLRVHSGSFSVAGAMRVKIDQYKRKGEAVVMTGPAVAGD